jgi:Holliday junction resolvasome RuvABC ATP-dependent DNA helicase subunit
MCEVLWRNISDFYVNLWVEVAAVSSNRYGVEKTVDTHKILINLKCNNILCLSSRNMIDKTMCEVLWRNISDFYVNLRVEVGKHPQVILAMYFYLGQE